MEEFRREFGQEGDGLVTDEGRDGVFKGEQVGGFSAEFFDPLDWED